MIVSEIDASWAADEFINYFDNFTSIEDYLRYVKKEVINSTTSITPLHDEFFNEDIHPEDMEFDIKFVGNRFDQSIPQEHYVNLLRAVSSHNNESNIPGRELRWMIYEKNTKKVVGFIRFGSPTINSKPRNIWLGNKPNLSIFNRHAAMGFVIVPSQPFGYNYLGGKLLALLCCSHFARETLNEVFEKDIALFETTSLYGSTTDASQYEGLKPFMRYKGLTESKFLPLLHDEVFHRLHDRFTLLNNNTPLTDKKASSKKMKRQTKMISIIKNSLKDEEKLNHFNSVLDTAFNLTQKKRFYISDYGYSNVREVILGDEKKLLRGPNWEKHDLDNIVKWWKRKASKRYQKLKEEGRFRNKVELWTDDDDIQIIR
ncbi:MAG: hypothetical protein CBD74_13040 [Saprospirales bacterium TMED214]|nr:MAG: hypothetical protein CBD74_13040 [Saprospirales bacterium TMED214]